MTVGIAFGTFMGRLHSAIGVAQIYATVKIVVFVRDGRGNSDCTWYLELKNTSVFLFAWLYSRRGDDESSRG